MKNFLVICLGSASDKAMKDWQALTPEARKEKEQAGMSAWKNWVSKNSNSIKVVGSPIGKTKRVDAKGISDTKNLITAYTVVEAESQEAAAKLFINHPHFTIFPGEAIEVMECLPIPG